MEFILENGKLYRSLNGKQIEQMCPFQQPVLLPVSSGMRQGVAAQRQMCGVHCPLFIANERKFEVTLKCGAAGAVTHVVDVRNNEPSSLN